MNKLTKRILCYFVKASVIDIQNITNTPFIDINNQFSHDQLKVGEKARELTTVLSEEGFEEECDMFFQSCPVILYYIYSNTNKKVSF